MSGGRTQPCPRGKGKGRKGEGEAGLGALLGRLGSLRSPAAGIRAGAASPDRRLKRRPLKKPRRAGRNASLDSHLCLRRRAFGKRGIAGQRKTRCPQLFPLSLEAKGALPTESAFRRGSSQEPGIAQCPPTPPPRARHLEVPLEG